MAFWNSLLNRVSSVFQTVSSVAQGVVNIAPSVLQTVGQITKPFVSVSTNESISSLAVKANTFKRAISTKIAPALTMIRLLSPSTADDTAPEEMASNLAGKAKTYGLVNYAKNASSAIAKAREIAGVDPEVNTDSVVNAGSKASSLDITVFKRHADVAWYGAMDVAPMAIISPDGFVVAADNKPWVLPLHGVTGLSYSIASGTGTYQFTDPDSRINFKPYLGVNKGIYKWRGVMEVYYTAVTTALATNEKLWVVAQSVNTWAATPNDFDTRNYYVDISGSVGRAVLQDIDFSALFTAENAFYFKVARKIGSTLEWASLSGLGMVELHGFVVNNQPKATDVSYTNSSGDLVSLTGNECWGDVLGRVTYSAHEDPNFSVAALHKARLGPLSGMNFGLLLRTINKYTNVRGNFTSVSEGTDNFSGMIASVVRGMRADLSSMSDDDIFTMVCNLPGYVYSDSIMGGLTKQDMYKLLNLVRDKIEAVRSLVDINDDLAVDVVRVFGFKPME